MVIKDLIRIIADSYPLDIVDFKNEYPNESYCIKNNNGQWEVYYSERGQKTGLTKCNSESEACEHLLKKIQTSHKKGHRYQRKIKSLLTTECFKRITGNNRASCATER